MTFLAVSHANVKANVNTGFDDKVLAVVVFFIVLLVILM